MIYVSHQIPIYHVKIMCIVDAAFQTQMTELVFPHFGSDTHTHTHTHTHILYTSSSSTRPPYLHVWTPQISDYLQ